MCSALAAQGLTFVHISGDDTQSSKETKIDQLVQGKVKVGVLSTRALGVGVTLVPTVTLVIKIDRDWTPGVEDQADDRVHRIGCQYPVHVIMYKAKGTYDVRLFEMLLEKARVNRTCLGDDLVPLFPEMPRFFENAPPKLSANETFDAYIQRVGVHVSVTDEEVQHWPFRPFDSIDIDNSTNEKWINITERPTSWHVPKGDAILVGDVNLFIRKQE